MLRAILMTGVLSMRIVRPLYPFHAHSNETALALVEKVFTERTFWTALAMFAVVSERSWDTESRQCRKTA